MTPRVRLYACIEGARFRLNPEQVVGDCCRKDNVQARWAVIRRLNKDGFSSAQIGRWMNRDHSSILHALKHVGWATRQV